MLKVKPSEDLLGYLKYKHHKIKKKLKLLPASPIAHRLLKGLKGIEIGAGVQTDFKLNTKNIDCYPLTNNEVHTLEQMKIRGKVKKIDIVAFGDKLPFRDDKFDFVVNSHVLEHFYDPIGAILEWYRVIKPKGYIFMIIPHKERTFDKERNRSTLQELIERHEFSLKNPDIIHPDYHYSVWITEDVLELCRYLNLDVIEYHDIDDHVGNGFTIIIKKREQ